MLRTGCRSVLLLAGVLVFGCGGGGGGDGGQPAMIEKPSGLKYQDLTEGEGKEVARGDVVEVHYTGWLAENNRQFDTSKGDKPLRVKVGAGRVIQGWDEGLQGMKPRGKRKLYVPSKMGYGPGGYPPEIPPNADLVFEVELVRYGQ